MWVSPRRHPFRTQTPLWVQACGQEVLLEHDREWYEAMRDVQGNRVEWHLVDVANHDILLGGNLTGFEEEANEAARAAGKWLLSL
jgi:acetyl esterase/lipase